MLYILLAAAFIDILPRMTFFFTNLNVFNIQNTFLIKHNTKANSEDLLLIRKSIQYTESALLLCTTRTNLFFLEKLS